MAAVRRTSLEGAPVPILEIPFEQECPDKKRNKSGEIVEFSCRKGGVSPLTGATYRQQEAQRRSKNWRKSRKRMKHLVSAATPYMGHKRP